MGVCKAAVGVASLRERKWRKETAAAVLRHYPHRRTARPAPRRVIRLGQCHWAVMAGWRWGPWQGRAAPPRWVTPLKSCPPGHRGRGGGGLDGRLPSLGTTVHTCPWGRLAVPIAIRPLLLSQHLSQNRWRMHRAAKGSSRYMYAAHTAAYGYMYGYVGSPCTVHARIRPNHPMAQPRPCTQGKQKRSANGPEGAPCPRGPLRRYQRGGVDKRRGGRATVPVAMLASGERCPRSA